MTNFGVSVGHRFLQALRFLALTIVFTVLLGCGEGHKPADADVDRVDALYTQYLTGSVDQAREAMLEAVKIVAKNEYEEGHATGLCLGYGRLFCIESRIGDTNLAHIYYEKSKYWGLIRMELRGASPAEVKAGLEDYTPERCKKLILEFDAAHTKGAGPRYMQE